MIDRYQLTETRKRVLQYLADIRPDEMTKKEIAVGTDIPDMRRINDTMRALWIIGWVERRYEGEHTNSRALYRVSEAGLKRLQEEDDG